MVEKNIRVRTGNVWLTEEGIIHQLTLHNIDFTLSDAEEVTTAMIKLAQAKPRPALVHMEFLKIITKEARKHFADTIAVKDNGSVNAVALIVKTPVSRVLGSFFLRFNRPENPLKLFTSESEALKWLRGYLS